MKITIELKAQVMRSFGSDRARSNQVNNSRHGIRAVQARSCATKDFGRFQLRDIDYTRRDARGWIAARVVEPLPVKDYQDPVGRETAQAGSRQGGIGNN